jgi:hypothetical protein
VGLNEKLCSVQQPSFPLAHPPMPNHSWQHGSARINEASEQMCRVDIESSPKHGRQFRSITTSASSSRLSQVTQEFAQGQGPVATEIEVDCGSCSNPQTETMQRSVHFALSSQCVPRLPPRGILKSSRSEPLYHHNLVTPLFLLYVKFDNVHITIVYNRMRFRANLLLDFEDTIRKQFWDDSRTSLETALAQGYRLIIFTRGFKKRVAVYIRGPRSVHADAAFTGFLNTVRSNASVLLEWEGA